MAGRSIGATTLSKVDSRAQPPDPTESPGQFLFPICASPALNRALRDKNPNVRFGVAQALGQIMADGQKASNETLQALVGATQDTVKEVRLIATITLGAICKDPDVVISVYLRGLQDEVQATRTAQAGGSFNLKSRRANDCNSVDAVKEQIETGNKKRQCHSRLNGNYKPKQSWPIISTPSAATIQ